MSALFVLLAACVVFAVDIFGGHIGTWNLVPLGLLLFSISFGIFLYYNERGRNGP